MCKIKCLQIVKGNFQFKIKNLANFRHLINDYAKSLFMYMCEDHRILNIYLNF